jgi:hypothetical protein
MGFRRSRLVREALIGILAFPLLATGACADIMETALIRGFFDAATPLLVDCAESRLAPDGNGDGSASESDGP